MRVLGRILLVLLVALPSLSIGQKKLLDHTVYDGWKEVKGSEISRDGKWVTYQINPQEGDGVLYLYNTEKGTKDSVARGEYSSFGPESNYLFFKISPHHDTLRTLKLAKTKSEKLPKDTGAVWVFDKDTLVTFPKIGTADIPEEGDWIALKSSTSTYKPKSSKKKKKRRKKKEEPKLTTDGKDVTLFNSKTLKKIKLKRVVSHDLSDDGKWFICIQHLKKDTVDTYTVNVWELDSNSKWEIYRGGTSSKRAQISYYGKYAAFMTSQDTSKNKIYGLAMWEAGKAKAEVIVDSATADMPEGWSVSEHFRPKFSEDETRLYIGTAPLPYNAPKDTLLDKEKFKVDVWSWHDLELQPMQLLSQDRDRKKTYDAVVHCADRKFVQLADEDMDSYFSDEEKTHYWGIGKDDSPYALSYSWRMPWPSDYYLVNEKNGQRVILFTELGSRLELSPDAKNVIYFNEKDSTWYALDISSDKDAISGDEIKKITPPSSRVVPISKLIKESVTRDNNGSPYLAGSRGSAGWLKGDDYVLINSEWNVWKVDVRGLGMPEKLVANGQDSVTYRHIHWNNKERHTDLERDPYFRMYSKKTKGMGMARLDGDQAVVEMEGGYYLTSESKARDANTFMFKKQTFQDYPDLWVSQKGFEGPKKITDANPQQAEYNWGTVELIKWKSYKGIPLEGLLYKPENFDASKKYPLMVYFYERYDHSLHAHYVPKPTASIVFPTEYVSNGYIVFIPNVEYTPGHPGKSAYDCILNGTDYLLDQHDWIDSTKMALQGQSWGGYQTAYLVTQTNRYAAAMAGAPVSNMTSAYGGIRWGSGMSRMFQYERTQSRIGHTLWDSLDLYIENSPIFFAPNVNTPLLIMHNDDDGAVPWYQGIEYFVALRRLEKKVWMLNYNDDKHNLMRRANRKDLSIRMRQFFDHYLLDKPAPDWMENGLPAIDKGRKTGYDLIEK